MAATKPAAARNTVARELWDKYVGPCFELTSGENAATCRGCGAQFARSKRWLLRRHLGWCSECPPHVRKALDEQALLDAELGTGAYGSSSVYTSGRFVPVGFMVARCAKCNTDVRGTTGSLSNHAATCGPVAGNTRPAGAASMRTRRHRAPAAASSARGNVSSVRGKRARTRVTRRGTRAAPVPVNRHIELSSLTDTSTDSEIDEGAAAAPP